MVLSSFVLLMEADVGGAAGLLGSTMPTPIEVLPRSPVLGWTLAPTTGLEVLSLVEGRVEEDVLVVELWRDVGAFLGAVRLLRGATWALLPLRRRR